MANKKKIIKKRKTLASSYDIEQRRKAHNASEKKGREKRKALMVDLSDLLVEPSEEKCSVEQVLSRAVAFVTKYKQTHSRALVPISKKSPKQTIQGNSKKQIGGGRRNPAIKARRVPLSESSESSEEEDEDSDEESSKSEDEIMTTRTKSLKATVITSNWIMANRPRRSCTIVKKEHLIESSDESDSDSEIKQTKKTTRREPSKVRRSPNTQPVSSSPALSSSTSIRDVNGDDNCESSSCPESYECKQSVQPVEKEVHDHDVVAIPINPPASTSYYPREFSLFTGTQPTLSSFKRSSIPVNHLYHPSDCSIQNYHHYHHHYHQNNHHQNPTTNSYQTLPTSKQIMNNHLCRDEVIGNYSNQSQSSSMNILLTAMTMSDLGN